MKSLLLFVLIVPLVAAAYDLGDPVADIVLTDLEGLDVALSDHAGEIVVLNFFATWCVGCNEEAAVLEQDIWQVYQDSGVTVIAIDIAEPAALVRGWMLANQVTYHIWLAPDWSVFDLFADSRSIPFNTVLDRDHTLRYSQLGFDREVIIDMIETIIEEDTTPASATTWSGIKSLYGR